MSHTPDEHDDLFAPLTPEEIDHFPPAQRDHAQDYFDAFIREMQRQLDAIEDVDEGELP